MLVKVHCYMDIKYLFQTDDKSVSGNDCYYKCI